MLGHVWPLLTQASKAALTAMRQQDKDRRRVQLSYAEFVRLVVRTLEVEREAGRLSAYALSADEAKASAPRARSAARAQHGQDGTGACQYINGQVVWKKIFYVSSGREKVVDMWRLETSCLVQARHLGVVPLLHAADEQNLTFVCEYISSISLAKAITNQTRLGDRICMVLAHSIVCGLDALHRIGIVHSDLHAANVMLRPHVWSVLLVDFADANKHPSLEDCKHCSELLQQLGVEPQPLGADSSAWLLACMSAYKPDAVCLATVMSSKPPIALL